MTQKIWCRSDSAEIFKFSSVLIIATPWTHFDQLGKTRPVLKIGQDSTVFKRFWAHPRHWDCGSFWATSMWNDSQKIEKLKSCWCIKNENFWDFSKNECFGGKRWKKLWNWPFQVNLSLILEEKMEKPAKWPKLAILSQSKPLFWQNLPLCVILSCFSVKWFKTSCQCTPTPLQKQKILRFLQKWDTLVVKEKVVIRWNSILSQSEHWDIYQNWPV